MRIQLCDVYPGRREFLRHMAVTGLVLPAIAIAGCDSGDGGVVKEEATGLSNRSGSITNNHGHTVVLTEAQLQAGAAVTLDLTQGGGHTHTVALSADQVQAIEGGDTVSVTSSVNSGHSHNVTF